MFIFLFNALGLWAEVTAPPPADAMLIEVTGQQFAWNVRYPGKDGVLGSTDHLQASQDNPIGLVKDDPAAKDDLLLLNQIYLPKDRPVRVQLRSMDVIHSFFLPNFRVKQDAMPGMTIEIWFTPNEPATSRSRAPSTAASATTGCAGRCTSCPPPISTDRRRGRPVDPWQERQRRMAHAEAHAAEAHAHAAPRPSSGSTSSARTTRSSASSTT